jgi:uncharacterized protein YecE (DUF72 family)
MLGTLFEEQSGFDRELLAARLAGLASRGVLLGGSSWKYEGWLDQIYSRERYTQRGRFSRKRFEAECLSEYATTFPTVCGDFAFYQFPSPEYWAQLFARVPAGFAFTFKVPERITCKRFPAHARYASLAGKENESFLDGELLKSLFLAPLVPHRVQTGVLIFEFGTFSKSALSGSAEFLDRLDPFLAALPAEFRYAVEIRNPEFLDKDYFACLHRHNVAHVYNAWARMPELPRQLAIPDSATADFLVCRALLRQGRPYQEAVEKFAPYTDIQDPNPAARGALRALIHDACEKKQMLFAYVNNRLEGNAPLTILAVTEE